MSPWLPIASICIGLLYTAIQALMYVRLASVGTNRFVALWLVTSYIFLIGFDTTEKKRSLSLLVQTLLGSLVAVAVTALIGATAERLAIAALVGTLLGCTADLWAKHIG